MRAAQRGFSARAVAQRPPSASTPTGPTTRRSRGSGRRCTSASIRRFARIRRTRWRVSRARHAIRAGASRCRGRAGPAASQIGPRALERIRLDNAALLAHRIYNTDLDVFDQVWAKENGDLKKTIARIIELAKSRPKDPFGAMKDWVARLSIFASLRPLQSTPHG